MIHVKIIFLLKDIYKNLKIMVKNLPFDNKTHKRKRFLLGTCGKSSTGDFLEVICEDCLSGVYGMISSISASSKRNRNEKIIRKSLMEQNTFLNEPEFFRKCGMIVPKIVNL